MRIAAIADLHYRVTSTGLVGSLLGEIEQAADVLVIAGDLTDSGLEAEGVALAEELRALSLPIIAVLGNHDHEGDKYEVLCEILEESGVYILDGSTVEIDNITFVGTKGFCGGFDKFFIQPFGERALKAFINTSISEAIALENALAKVRTEHTVAVLHYAPIRGTLEGEPEELYPFLGSSRLENALDRQGVDVIFHGHAHHGYITGQTRNGIPVHNVSRFAQNYHSEHNFCIVNVG